MSESQYLQTVAATLAQVESAFDEADLGADCALSGLVLSVEFDDGARMVLNAQAPTRQLWLASRAGAVHFAFVDGAWRDVRSGAELFELLSRTVSEQLGRPVRLSR